jgi:hypothetical protein
MASIPNPTPRHGNQRASHLRQVSNDSSASNYDNRTSTRASDTNAAQYEPPFQKVPVERRCVLWIHEEPLSKDEVLLNLGLFPNIKPGELMAIIPLKSESGVRDYKEMPQVSNTGASDMPTAMQRDRSSSNPRSISQDNGTDISHDVDLRRRYLFLAKDIGADLKSRQPGLEVSVAKHVADMFSFKHRSSVLVTTVCFSATPGRRAEYTNRYSRQILPPARHLMLNCLSRMSISHGPICGGLLSVS